MGQKLKKNSPVAPRTSAPRFNASSAGRHRLVTCHSGTQPVPVAPAIKPWR